MMTKIKLKELLLVVIGGFSLQTATAQDTAAAVDKGTFTFNGYADVNYFYNLNNPRSGSNTGSSLVARAFDQKENQFQLGLVQGKMTYVYKKSTVVADIVFGPHADLGNYGNVVGPLGSTTSLAIKQAYITHAFSDKFSVTAGQWGTHVGYEVIDAPLNFNYSLSNCFTNGPFYHTGIKADFAISSKIALMAGIVNNWDALYDNNKYKTVIAQVKIAPSDKLTMYFNYVGGNETTGADSLGTAFNAPDTTKSFLQLIDFVMNYQVTDQFYVGLNAVVGGMSNADTSMNWGGVALYTNYAFSDMFTLGARAEYFDNTQGVRAGGKAFQAQSYTLTGKISLADGRLFFKPEVRFDLFGKDQTGAFQFEDNQGKFTKPSQLTVGAAAIYKF